MNFFEKLRSLKHHELRMLAGLTLAAGLLAVMALILSGSAPFLPQSLRVALERVHLIAATNAASPYWSDYYPSYSGSSACTIYNDCGPHDCPANVGGSVIDLASPGGTYGAAAYGKLNGTVGSSSVYYVTPGSATTLEYWCRPTFTSVSYYGCKGPYFGTESVATQATVTGPTGSTLYSGGTLSGSLPISPPGSAGSTGTYTLSCSGGGWPSSAQVAYQIIPLTMSLQACDPGGGNCSTQKSIAVKGTSQLQWTTQNVQTNSCTITGPNGPIGTQGLGTDASGNGSNWTVNNITPGDQTLDTPTNNFATLNSIYSFPYKGTLQAGGLAVAGDHTYSAVAGWQLNSGTWYWEYTPQPGSVSSDGYPVVGLYEDTNSGFGSRLYPGYNYDTGIGWGSDGRLYSNGQTVSTLPPFVAGDVLGVAYDADSGKVYFSKNGAWQGPSLVPIMTGGTTNGVTVDASAQYTTGYPAYAWKAADGNTGYPYYWYSYSGAGIPSVSNPVWWRVDFGAGNSKTAASYSINHTYYSNGYVPVDFKLQGSNNENNACTDPGGAGTWYDLDTHTGVSWAPAGESKSFTLTTPGSYRCYRLRITASESSGSYILIDEISLFGSASPAAGTGYAAIVHNGWPGLSSYYGKTLVNFGQSASSRTYGPGSYTFSAPSGFTSLQVTIKGAGAGDGGPSGGNSSFNSNLIGYGGTASATGGGAGPSVTTVTVGGGGAGAPSQPVYGTCYDDFGNPYSCQTGSTPGGYAGGMAVHTYRPGEIAGSVPVVVGAAGSGGVDGSVTIAVDPGGNYSSASGGSFVYAAPSGYSALSTDNLPAPAVGNPSQYFAALAYAGNGGTQTVTAGFAPDLVWIKNRLVAYANTLTDSSRGGNSDLFTNSSAPVSTNDPNGWVSALTGAGFTVGGQCAATPPQTNLAGNSYISWALKKSPTAGFDIVTYAGDGTASRQVTHALGAVPEMVVVKRTDGTGDWYVWTKDLPDQSYYLKFNTADAAANIATPWGGAASGNVSSAYFTVGTGANSLNTQGAAYVAYLFKSVSQFSQVGSYVSNGSADGPFVHTGFKPKFVMVKDISESNSSTNWTIIDATRDTQDPRYQALFGNLGAVEEGDGTCTGSTTCNVDFLANGFKLRSADWENNAGDPNLTGTNDTYIYLAFADTPFKNSAGALNNYTVANSLRFDASTNPYLTRTPAASGNQQKFTLSFWVKHNSNAAHQFVLSSPSNPYDEVAFGWDCGTDQLDVHLIANRGLCSTALFRDPAHWYHVVIAIDVTQPVSTNKIKLYIDGVQSTLTGTFPTNTTDTTVDFNVAGKQIQIGRSINWGGYNLDGNLADLYFIDGAQLMPTTFGGYDSTGIWRPKVYSGVSYGTNGFHLTFADSLNPGADTSGWGNNFNAVNLSALDQTADTPSNSFATLNSLYYYAASYGKSAVQGGGLAANGNWGAAAGQKLSSGLWYWEYTSGSVYPAYSVYGIWSDPSSGNPNRAYPGHNNDYGFGYSSGGNVLSNAAVVATLPAFSSGDVISTAYDANTGRTYFADNGRWMGPDAIPYYMTGTTYGGVSMTGSIEYNPAWKAGDKEQYGASYWESYRSDGTGNPNNGYPQWLRVDLSTGKTVGTYSIEIYSLGTYDPVDWKLQGSNDATTCSAGTGVPGTVWSDLDTHTGFTWGVSYQTQLFTVQNPLSYRCYRVYVTRTDSNHEVIIEELGLYQSADPATGTGYVGTVLGGTPGLSSYGKTYVNFGQGGGEATTFADSSSYGRAVSLGYTNTQTVAPTSTIYKFGSTSAYFGGQSALVVPSSPELTPTGDFTVDFWMYHTGSGYPLSKGNNYDSYSFYDNGSGLYLYAASNGPQSGWDIGSSKTICPSLTANTWYHVALVRSGGTYYSFCNGVSTNTPWSAPALWQNSYPVVIGANTNGFGTRFTGAIDELRISNVARWTGNFTPPSGAYSSDANTLLLLHMEDARSSLYRSGTGGYYAYPPPAGYLALSTANLTTPAITQPKYYFDAKAYGGNSGAPALDSVNKGSYVTLTNGNYDAQSSTNCCWTNDEIYSTSVFSSGKYYAEFKVPGNYPVSIGIADSSKRQNVEQELGYLPAEYAYDPYSSGRVGNNNVWTSGFPALSPGDVIQVAVDMTAGKIWFGKNGAWLGSGNPAAGTGAQFSGITGNKVFGASILSADGTVQAQFGQAGRTGTALYSGAGGYFFYQPPSGFQALPSGASQDVTLNFKPGLVWIKDRFSAFNNTLVDSVRGTAQNLFSNTSGAQISNDINGTVTSFNSNGFTVGASCAAPSGNFNSTGNSYAAWVWKKSPTAGIDIASYAGTGSTTWQTVSQALGSAPDLILTKRTDQAGDWFAWFSALGGGQFLKLNTTDAATSNAYSPYGADLIPVMDSSNNVNGVSMSGSTEYQPAWYAGDKSTSSYWSTYPNYPNSGSSQWLKVDLGSGKTVGAYTIRAYSASAYYTPADFQLQGSSDNASWATLDTESGTGWVGYGTSKTFSVPTANQASYRYYRVYVTKNIGNEAIIAELNLWPSAMAGTNSFSVTGAGNIASAQYLSYLFSNREGFSKAGTYVANSSADGPFVYTGFKPKFVLIKDTSRNNAYTNWTIYDSSRDPANPMYHTLFANLGVIENGDASCTTSGNCGIDFLANGFKPRNAPYNTNYSIDTYAYVAFADVPFKSASTPANLDIPYSMRFDASQTAYLKRTFNVAGNNTTATLSMWVKRGQLGTYQYIYTANSAYSNTGFFGVYFDTSDRLLVTGWPTTWRTTNQPFRDPAHWYHITVAVDTTQPDSAANNRIRLYVDGAEVTSFAILNNPAQSAPLGLNAAGAHYFSTYEGTTYPFDGYLADIYWIDGSQLAPSDFGEYDPNGFWKPKAYPDTYGTDGFHLDFGSTGNTDFSQGSGSLVVGPLLQTSVYTLTCTSLSYGVPVSTQATVNVTGSALSLTACNAAGTSCSSGSTPAFVKSGENAYLYWSALGADSNSCNTYAPGALTSTVQSFTAVGTTNWTIPAGVTSVDALVVGGGGGGGGTQNDTYSSGGGGGGAGGYRYVPNFSVTPGQSYTITVGLGGSGGAAGTYPASAGVGGSGGNSVFGSITAAGGGGGGHGGYTAPSPGAAGGSGGGGGDVGASPPGGSGNTPATSPSQGNDGGSGYSANPYGAGGGGGASAPGGNAASVGTGGAGTANSITGASVTYAGGGGGGTWSSGTLAAGGAGGGGAGGQAADGTPGSANRGGGGGGGGAAAGAGHSGGAGGSGVVVLRYMMPAQIPVSPVSTNSVSHNTPSQTPTVTGDTTYTLMCTVGGNPQSTTASVTTSQACQTTTSGSAGTSCSAQCALNSADAVVAPGQTTTLSWCCPTPPTSGTNFSTGGTVSGSVQVGPGTYQLSCPAGTGSITVAATVQPPATMTLFASPSRIRQSGNTTQLSWVVIGMASGLSCTMSPAIPGGLPVWNGSNPWSASAQSGAITPPTTYTLTCGNGTASTSASVNLGLVPNFKEK